MSNINFSCNILSGLKKQGVLKPDKDGYYTLPVGGLNVFNSNGSYYTYEGAKELFNNSSSFMRKVKNGCLKGETGHPSRLPGQSLDSFAARVMQIDEKNVCVHFSEIWLDFDNVVDADGKKVIAIMAKLIPSGPNGPALQKSLDNPKEEVCFSIRAFTEDHYLGGIKQRILREIVSFDHVGEPGISFAKKYYSPVLESKQEVSLSRENILHAINGSIDGVGMESVRACGEDLFKRCGWSLTKSNAPSWFNWE